MAILKRVLFGDGTRNLFAPTVARVGGGRWRIFLSPPLRACSRPIRMENLESHITYLAGSHVPRSWPGIRLMERGSGIASRYVEVWVSVSVGKEKSQELLQLPELVFCYNHFAACKSFKAEPVF